MLVYCIELQGTDEQDTTTCEQQEMDEQDTTTSEQQDHGNSMEDQANQNIDQESVDYLTLVQWICLILIKLKLRYNCSNSLFSLIVNLIYFILSLIKHPLHLFFPQTLNDLMLISNLRVYNECEIMAVCPNLKCNCLYKLSDIVRTHNGEKMSKVCKNKIFGKTCQAELAYPEHLSFGRRRWVPFKKFPFLPPSKWIKLFFKNKEFYNLILNRPEPSMDGSLRDMWDGRVLKLFMKDPQDNGKSLLEDKRNLALLLYLDFFNPFTRAIYSSGALCMTVLNLPRGARFQKKWSMLIGIIPGPEEAQGHVNSFLKPVVDDLLLLYDGIEVSEPGRLEKTFVSRSVLLPVLADIPASRKLSQFLSFKAEKLITFVDNFLVDPMHNLFLGLVEDVGNAVIVGDENFITADGRDVFERRMDSMRIPYDVGRLPHTMLQKMSGRGITAQQWKNFIITFARVCLWKQVSTDAYRMVCRLAEACEIILRDPLNTSDITHLDKLLNDHHKLYGKVFGEYSVSVNYHMALHLPEQILNWGPPTAWWCFPFERRIGELSDTLTSGKSIEEQIFNHYILQHCADHLPMPVLPDLHNQCIPALIAPLLETSSDGMTESTSTASLRKAAEDFFTGSSSIHNTKVADPFQLQMTVEKEESSVIWPVILLPPQRLNKRVQFSFLKQLKQYFGDVYDDEVILVEPRIDIFARCKVNGTTFSSQYNRTDRGSNILSYCVDSDHQGMEIASPYFAKVDFFFKANVHISSNGSATRKTHSLAYVNWYRFANRNHSVDESSGLHALNGLFYKGDNILNARRLIRRVVLTEVKKNYLLVSNLSQ